MDTQMKLLEKLTNLPGISGYEKPVRDAMKEEFKALGVNVSYDNIGSIIGEHGNKGPKIAISGHMDEIGMLVTKITEDGFLKFQTIGGWWANVMLAQQYDVHSTNGKVYRAVMGSKPPHMLEGEERTRAFPVDQMYFDLGVKNKEEVLALGIKPGCPVTPAIQFQTMANPDYLLAKAFDNRAGCGVAIEVMRNVLDCDHPNTLYSIGSVQEEVGCRGARTTAQKIQPDVVFALDVTISSDTPGTKGSAVMGKGPAILLYDSSLIGHEGLRNFVCKVADELGIPYQIDYLSRGGTDAGAMHVTNAGAPAMSLCVPSRYIHSHTSMISYSDYLNTIKLLTEVVKRLDDKAYQEILNF